MKTLYLWGHYRDAPGRLEALLDRFNILEALGVVRQELRHSDFLAFSIPVRITDSGGPQGRVRDQHEAH